jgi:hypothetical protein
MFGTKKDRGVVALTIEFNLTAIGKWLNDNGETKDIEKMNKFWDEYSEVIQRYHIDVLPNGQVSDMYFHREKGVITNVDGGIDYLRNVDNNLKSFLKNTKIEVLAWGSLRQSVSLRVNEKNILFAPVDEIIELQKDRKLKNGKLDLFAEPQKIKVPISFDDDNQPKEFAEVWRISRSPNSVGYQNALGSVSASTELLSALEY